MPVGLALESVALEGFCVKTRKDDVLCLIRRRLSDRRTSAESSRDGTEMSEVPQTRTFDSVHITLNIETGSLLPLALR